MKYALHPTDMQLLDTYLCPEVRDNTEQGYEEWMEINITYLLKSCLNKNNKENIVLNNIVLEMPSTTERLIKHMGLLWDRIGKGARLKTNMNNGSTNVGNTNITNNTNNTNGNVDNN